MNRTGFRLIYHSQEIIPYHIEDIYIGQGLLPLTCLVWIEYYRDNSPEPRSYIDNEAKILFPNLETNYMWVTGTISLL